MASRKTFCIILLYSDLEALIQYQILCIGCENFILIKLVYFF